MTAPILATKLYIPPPRPNAVHRVRLIERLNTGFRSGHPAGVTLISAPAGFGKTTLVSSWLEDLGEAVSQDSQIVKRAAWLSLDEGDNDLARFLTYLVGALQTITPTIGAGLLAMLQSPQLPATDAILTGLLNDIAVVQDSFVLVLDDYHVIQTQAIDEALAFLIEHRPPQLQLVIVTREDPQLPLPRLRVRGQLIELRAADLRFTPAEAADFLNQGMGLNLSEDEIMALETRTEGWIAGLQLAALSMQGHQDTAGFIQSFTGSHRFVMDYLVEEVLHRQPEQVQTFLLQTSILDRLCGSLCEAVLLDSTVTGQATLEYLEQANLFIVPLDSERRWYRYHHLFADLLRQQLHRRSLTPTGNSELDVTKLHIRASAWYEANGLEIEAFQHAVAANDIGRAERLIEGDGMPLHFRGTVAPILSWLASLPTTVLDARPSLWVTYASVLTFVGQPTSEVEAKLQAAEAALRQAEPNDKTRDLSGHIATIRAMLAIPLGQVETILDQSNLALELLQPDNLPVRTFTTWTLGLAYQLQGDRAAAEEAFTAAIAISQASGNTMVTIAAATCLGQVRETENQLYGAAESYQQVLNLIGDPPWPTACEAYLGLARVHYQWNDLTAAEQYGQLSLQLAKQVKNVPTPASCGVFLVQLKLAQGDVTGAAAILAETEQFVHQRNFVHLLPEIAAARMLVLLHQGDPVTAAQLAEQYDLPLSRARVHLAQGDPATALTALVPFDQHAEAKGWVDEQLRVMVLQALAYQAQGEKMPAIRRLDEALALAEPGGFIRLFVDEGQPLATLLVAASAQAIRPGYVGRLLTAFESALYNEGQTPKPAFSPPVLDPPLLVEPLSQRELEVLQLIAQGLSNREISERLFLALDTVKGHNRRIFSKLQVQRRTEAVAKARALNLLPDSD